ncbi:hypothetical protein RRG08_040882 [Elysia crispata]|uniref:Uncharacterized protein n=1 Tax=Elysia crispata TaxID=231223 RepID=A0AAE1AZA2_9GAST|nr:hypothetical protein RRG08_040882 [Elysia crispata]
MRHLLNETIGQQEDHDHILAEWTLKLKPVFVFATTSNVFTVPRNFKRPKLRRYWLWLADVQIELGKVLEFKQTSSLHPFPVMQGQQIMRFWNPQNKTSVSCSSHVPKEAIFYIL